MVKTCSKCSSNKPLNLFYRRSGYKHRYRSICKVCTSGVNSKRRTGSEFRSKQNEYNAKMEVRIKKSKYECKPEIVEKRNTRRRLRYQDEANYKLTKVLRSRLSKAIKNNFKSGSAVRDLGCSIEELKRHLESQFTEGMGWDNYGKWHIDHIKPLSSFNLTKAEELKKACHFSNLQPLWAKDNLKKGNK